MLENVTAIRVVGDGAPYLPTPSWRQDIKLHYTTTGDAAPTDLYDNSWVADYTNAVPALPAGWTDWTFWQFSETGSCDGVSGHVDLNHFSGDVMALQDFIMHQHA